MNLVFKMLVARYGPQVARYVLQYLQDEKAHRKGGK